MNINKAIQHFEFKLVEKDKNGKVKKLKDSFTPTIHDVNAYNAFVEYHENNNKQQINDNQLFAKLYIKYYSELIKYYRSSLFDKEPQKDINRLLDTPIEDVINEFRETIRTIEQSKMFEVNGTLKHPLKWSEEDKKSISMSKVELIPYEEAADNLIATVNLALNTFK